MADERITMLDAVKANAADDVVGLVEEVSISAPEFGFFPAKTIKGTSYKTRHRTAYPNTGFRGANEGQDASKSTYELRDVSTYILGGLVEADKAIADAYDEGPDKFKFEEALGVLESALITFGYQCYYGNPSATDKGFPGLQYMYHAGMELDATGTTADTGSSVYAVRLGGKNVTGIFGNNATMALDDWRIETILGANSKKLPGYVSDLCSWVGLQATSKHAVARLKNITEDSGKGLTDDLLYQLEEKFPANVKPDAFLMTRRSRRQLRESRTAVNALGSPAPMPVDVDGVPIIVTDSLLNTEAIA